MKNLGLTAAEVKERQQNGEINVVKATTSKSYASILISNVFTYFNAVFALFAIIFIIIGDYVQLTFLPVVLANIIIGIYQQMRSKAILDKLTLLDKSTYTVLRDGQEVKLPSDKLVKDDVIILEAGQQIPADCTVLEGELSVNESLLTGEADEIEKKAGSELLSGSFVISGTATVTLVKVGKESYSAKLTLQAKEIKDKQSEMIKDIGRIILCASIVIIPMGILLFCKAYFFPNKETAELPIIAGTVGALSGRIPQAITGTLGALIGMIPEGLRLLTTITLALSAIRLAQNHVLLHDMRSVETLARVDVLCVDKTGTITGNEMSVSDVTFPDCYFGKQSKNGAELSDKNSEQTASALLAAYVAAITDENATMTALKKHFCEQNGYFADKSFKAEKIQSFSSKTKCSTIISGGAEYSLGAPEFVLSEVDLQNHKPLITQKAEEGKRVLAFRKSAGGKTEFCIFICIHNEIRENARDIFEYFNKQGVAVKVISGDNPLTVSKIAKQAGIKNAEKFIDATTLQTDEDIQNAVKTYTVFGRVKPEQKKQIILALKACGLKVAMTGDGVNDILAMKEADCSIAMGSGSDAAREASQVVLMDSDFSHMKQIVSEGRRDINNITRTSTLFLYKNIFSLLLAIFTLFYAGTYPLEPVQVSLVSLFNVGMPAFLLTLEPNERKQKGKFITQTLIRAFPASLGAFAASAVLIFCNKNLGLSAAEQSTLTLLALSTAGFLLLFQAMYPITPYRVAVAALCVLGFGLTTLILGDHAGLAPLTLKAAGFWAILALFEAVITFSTPIIFNKIAAKKIANKALKK